ncbi:MAG: TIGR03663 family protein, partial [Chloroflexota bacterium]|nr:TIGR03663 family protein [Chloroflexota bacterium]
MDNRRMSARTDIGGTSTIRPINATVPLLDRALEITRVNWELLFFVGIMLLGIFTRLWDLGPRALHHDESIHAYFSNYFLHTGNYTTTANFGGGYDPTYHGPFLYHVTALMFFLFGTTDATARLGPALFGIVLIGLCWLLRPFIGRLGAVLSALLITLSPSITYYSRSLRHDIFALTGTMLLFVSILWFLRTHQARWVYLGAVGLAIAYASHELTYIIAFIFVAFLLITAFVFPVFARRAEHPTREWVGDEEVNPVRSALISLLAQRWTLLGGVLTFVGIYAVLFTSMFTKPNLIFSGIIEGLKYWLGEQKTQRGNQPLFYYLLLMPIYEPLAFFGGLGTVGYMVIRWIRGDKDRKIAGDDVDLLLPAASDEYGVVLPSMSGMRGLTLGFLAFWSFGALIAFSLAGERLPWLNMQMALPFSLLVAAGLSKLISGTDWREVRKGGGAFLGVALVLFIFAAFAFIANLTGQMPKAAGVTADLQNNIRGVLLFLITTGLLVLSGWLAYKMLPGRAVAVAGVTLSLLLLIYGVRSMTLANYQHGDVPVEMLVYTQSAPDVPIVASMIQRLSRDETSFDAGRNANDVTGGHGLTIAIDQNDAIEWPLDWYFRDMRSITYFNLPQWEQNQANIVAPNQAVIMSSEGTETNPNFAKFIKDKGYTTRKYVLNWWFPEDAYKVNGQNDIGQAWRWLTGNGMKYLLYRDPGLPLGSRNFYVHVRSDLATKVGIASGLDTSSGGPTTPGTLTDTGKISGMYDLAPAGASKGAFNLPRGITVAPDGSFYVVDTANYRIQKFDAAGKFLLQFGSKGNADGQFNPFADDALGTGPGGIAVDKSGNVYVADTWNHRIEKFDSNGKFLAKWGEFINLSDPSAANDGSRDSKFFGPRGVAVGPDGNVYVTDTGNKRVVVFTAAGAYVRQIQSNVTP